MKVKGIRFQPTESIEIF